MNLLKTIASTAKKIIDTHQKNQSMRVLLELSNTQLEDIGISRYQLERGIKAYPWREVAAQTKQNAQSAQVLRFQRPVSTISTPVMGSPANASDTQQAA